MSVLHASDSMPMHEHRVAGAALSSAQVQFLSSYELVRAALAADDLAAAKAAAAKLQSDAAGEQLVKADSLNSARMDFKKLSVRAVNIARGHAGYHIAHCPMVDADWVQATTTICNPYLGAKMATCGAIAD